MLIKQGLLKRIASKEINVTITHERDKGSKALMQE